MQNCSINHRQKVKSKTMFTMIDHSCDLILYYLDTNILKYNRKKFKSLKINIPYTGFYHLY